MNGNSYSENLLVHFQRVQALKQMAINLPSIYLNERQICDLELMLNRAFYPLTGYLHREDYESVIDNMRLANGNFWPMPVCLDINEKLATTLEKGGMLALRDQEGLLLAVLTVDDVWQYDKKREAWKIFGTDEADKHPGVRELYEQSANWYIGGSIEGIQYPVHYDFRHLRFGPSETHRLFAQNGWRNVIGFIVESTPHRSDKEATLRTAYEVGGNIFMHPIAALNHPGDLEHYTKVRYYETIAKHYPRNMIFLSLLPLKSRKAGPREALLQAIISKNYGCSHIFVSKDQADPMVVFHESTRFYPLHAAQELVEEYQKEIGIDIVPLRDMVYVPKKKQYLFTEDVAPEMTSKKISDIEVRKMLELGEEIPEWMAYPDVVEELRYRYPQRSQQGFTVFFTGLSGAGKSTIAKGLMVKLLEMRNRAVTLLDGDIVRKNLSSELGFSKRERDLNIQRIGFVASEITKNGGIAICAPIAPYEETRRYNRDLISQYGAYIEVYITTPLQICEQRDHKGLYAKARAGLIKEFTGIDDPYIPPKNPEIAIDTSEITPEEAVNEILFYLEKEGYIA